MYQIRSCWSLSVGQATQKVIAPEVDSQETQLPAPRFDEEAAQMARPVVPLSEEVLSTSPDYSTNLESQLTTLLPRKGAWLLATVVGLVLLAAGAMAIGVNAYRRNQVVSTQSLIPVVEATRMEINQVPGSERASSSSAPAIPKTKKHVERARPASDGRPRARMVDSYVIR